MKVIKESSKKKSYPKKKVKKENLSPAEHLELHYPIMTREFKRLQREDYELFCKKQYDYGPSNIAMGTTLENEEDVKLSTTGLVVRINDKVNRLINLTVKSDREGVTESVKDSFQDLTNYSIMARIVRGGKWGK